MKKIICLMLVLTATILCLCACSGEPESGSSIPAVQSEITGSTEPEVESKEQTNSSPISRPQNSQGSQGSQGSQSKPSTNNTSSKTPPIVDMENLSAAVIENFTDVQLEWVHNNAEKFPENFVFGNLEGYGKVIPSASSRRAAILNAKEKYTTTVYDVSKCEIISETDYFYTVYVKWVPKSDPDGKKYREEKAVCFKKDVFEIEKELSEGKILSQDKSLIKNIFDYCYYSQYGNLGGYKVLFSEVTEESVYYKYTVYFVGTVYGDKGLKDSVTLYKQTTIIEKDDGDFYRDDKRTLKKIGVIGEGYDGGDGFVGE